MDNKKNEDILEKAKFDYFDKFHQVVPMPTESMGDERYAAIIYKAIKRGTPLTDDDMDELTYTADDLIF